MTQGTLDRQTDRDEEAPASGDSSDMVISPSSRGTSADTGKTGTWKLVTKDTGDCTVCEDTGQTTDDNTDNAVVDGTVETGVDYGAEDGTMDGVEDSTGAGTEDVADASTDVLVGPQGCVQFWAMCPGCLQRRHRPENRQARARCPDSWQIVHTTG